MAPAEFATEKIPVRRIRVMHAAERATAVAASFFTVDRVLEEWARRGGGRLDCDFEIVYEDGITLCGRYQFQRKRSCRRPALMSFVCQRIAASCEGTADAEAPPLRGMPQGAQAFLQRYETNDFAPA